MPLGATAARPLLQAEEAWDLAAFVSSRPRPAWAGKLPFPTQNEKPFDYPIGPFGDPFPLTQHLLGPYGPIIDHWRTRSQTSVMDSMGI